jgi:hypothetical protein
MPLAAQSTTRWQILSRWLNSSTFSRTTLRKHNAYWGSMQM